MSRGSRAVLALLTFVLVATAIRVALPRASRKPVEPAPATDARDVDVLPDPREALSTRSSAPPSVDEPAARNTNESPNAEPASQHESRAMVADLLELAWMACDQGKYDSCRKLCDEILTILPEYCVALELQGDAAKAEIRSEYAHYLKKKVEFWRRMGSEDDANIPYADGLRFPNRAEWPEISRRISGTVIRSIPVPDRVTLSGTDLDLDQWLAVLAAAGVSIRLEGRPDHDGRITLHTGEIPVEEALDLIAVLFGLTWRRNEDFGIVLESCP